MLSCMGDRIVPAERLGSTPSSRRLSIHVLATTVEGTMSALTSARRLIDGHDARIALLVPAAHARGAFVEQSSGKHAELVEKHRALAASVGLHVTVLVCVCRRHDDLVHSMFDRSSLIVLGGRIQAWWPSREQRLFRRLTAEGYPAIFAQVGAEQAVPGIPVMVS
jgi:hypothetical protein